jgi:hypothetical protein
MRANRVLGGLVCLSLAALLDCQPKKESHAPEVARAAAPRVSRRPVSLPSAMGRLVPADAVALVRVASIDAAQASLRSLMQLAGKSDSLLRDPLMGLSRLGIDPEHLDRTRPLAIALTLVDLGRPTPLPTFILPARDVKELVSDLRKNSMLTPPQESGGWIGVSLLSATPMGRSTPAIGIDMPAGEISIRLRVDRIGRLVQPYLEHLADGLMKKAASPDSADRAQSAQVASAALQGVRRLLQSTEKLDLGASAAGGWLSVSYALKLVPGAGTDLFASPESVRGLTDLAKCLPPGYPAACLVALDFEKWTDAVESLYEPRFQQAARDLPDEVRDDYVSLVKATFELLRGVDTQMLAAGGLGDRGFDAVHVLRTRDADALLAKWRQLMAPQRLRGLGVEIEALAPEQIERIPVYGYRWKLDLEKIEVLGKKRGHAAGEKGLARWVGGGAPVVRMAAFDGKVAVVTGSDPEVMSHILTALKRHGGVLPPDLRDDMAEAREPLCLWGRLELRSLLVPIFEMAIADSASPAATETLEKMRAARPVPIAMYGTSGKDACHGAFRMDAGAFAELTWLFGKLPKHDHAREHD